MNKRLVLIANTDETVQRTIDAALVGCRTEKVSLTSVEGVREAVANTRPDLIVLGPSIEGTKSLDLARGMRRQNRSIPLVLIPPDSSEGLAISAVGAGINAYLKLPFSPLELMQALESCWATGSSNLAPSVERDPLTSTERMVGNSSAMQWLRQRLSRIAVSDSSLLVTGETGTGKELVAELVHRNSPRRSKPFVSINCAAIPDNLLESELFGYERGAFTGADCAKQGKLKAAAGGTVFLDEIGDMTPYAQAKLLRVLETKQVEPLGSVRGTQVDIRFVAATNRNIEQMVKEDKFRNDLFFRLNVVRVHLPPLRDRKEDIPSLLHHYIEALRPHAAMTVESIDGEALECLMAHDWPGNVRELRNLLESMFAEISSREITLAHLPAHLRSDHRDLSLLSGDEKEQLLRALASCNWNKSRVAARLKWSRMTVYRKMAKYKISSDFEEPEDLRVAS